MDKTSCKNQPVHIGWCVIGEWVFRANHGLMRANFQPPHSSEAASLFYPSFPQNWKDTLGVLLASYSLIYHNPLGMFRLLHAFEANGIRL